jgi:hypothetical protein
VDAAAALSHGGRVSAPADKSKPLERIDALIAKGAPPMVAFKKVVRELASEGARPNRGDK